MASWRRNANRHGHADSNRHSFQIRWAKVGENYRSWTDPDHNGFPSAPSYTIVGLDDGERYKISVRARFNVGSGPCAREVQADVQAAVSAPQLEAVPPTDTVVPPTDTLAPTTNTSVPPTDTAVPPTDTNIPPSDTAIPPTNTAVPPSDTPAPAVGPLQIRSVLLQGDPNGAIDVAWTVPTNQPVDYRISWAIEGQNYLSWRDESGNGYPVLNAYTITGLDVNACYKASVRARNNGSAGDWTEVKGKISGAC